MVAVGCGSEQTITGSKVDDRSSAAVVDGGTVECTKNTECCQSHNMWSQCENNTCVTPSPRSSCVPFAMTITKGTVKKVAFYGTDQNNPQEDSRTPALGIFNSYTFQCAATVEGEDVEGFCDTCFNGLRVTYPLCSLKGGGIGCDHTGICATSFDGGVTTDSGGTADSGVDPDSGIKIDAGYDASVENDAGASTDTGTGFDAGSVDAGAMADASVGNDVGIINLCEGVICTQINILNNCQANICNPKNGKCEELVLSDGTHCALPQGAMCEFGDCILRHSDGIYCSADYYDKNSHIVYRQYDRTCDGVLDSCDRISYNEFGLPIHNFTDDDCDGYEDGCATMTYDKYNRQETQEMDSAGGICDGKPDYCHYWYYNDFDGSVVQTTDVGCNGSCDELTWSNYDSIIGQIYKHDNGCDGVYDWCQVYKNNTNTIVRCSDLP